MAGDPKKLIKNLLEAGEFEAPDSTVNQIAQEWGNDYKGLVKSLLEAGEFEYGDQEVNALLSDFGLAGSPTPYAPNAVPVDLTFGLAPGLVTPLGSQTKPPKQDPKKGPVVPPGVATTGPTINWGASTVTNINPVTGKQEPPKKKKTEVQTTPVVEPPKAAIPPGAAATGQVIDWDAATVTGPTTGPTTGGPTIGLPRQTGEEIFADPLRLAEANDIKIKEAERIKKQIGEDRFNIYRDPSFKQVNKTIVTPEKGIYVKPDPFVPIESEEDLVTWSLNNELKPIEGSERDIENKALLDQFEKSNNDILEGTSQNIGLFLNDPEWRPKYEDLVGRANDISDKAEALHEKIKQKGGGVSPLNTEGLGESIKELRLSKDKQDEIRERLGAKREEIKAFKEEAQSRAANFTTQEDFDAYKANVEAIFKKLIDEESLLVDEINAVYEQVKPHIEKVDSYERKSKEEASKFSNDPDVKLLNSYVSDLKKLYNEIDVYRSAPDFPKFAKTYEEAYKNKDVRKNLFKSEAEAKKEADALRLYVEKLQKIRDFDKKYKGRSEFDDVLDDVVNFLRPAGLPVGKLSSFKRTLQSAAIESFVKPILGGLAWVSDSVTDNPYPSRYLRYGDNFSVQKMSEIQTGIEGVIPSKYQGDFIEKNFVIKKGDPLTSIFPEGTVVLTRGEKNDIIGFRDKDGYKVESLLDSSTVETIKNHINNNKDKVESDAGFFRGVLKTVPSALDFAILMAGAPGLARGLMASPLKLSRGAASAASTFGITMAQQIGRSHEAYLKQGNDTGKAALFAFGETAAIAAVETFVSPIESKLISRGLGAEDLAKFRKIKDTTIADIATGRIGVMDALGNLWRFLKEFSKTIGVENFEEFIQKDIEDVFRYVASGEEIDTTIEDRLNTVFSTSLITFLPAISSGVTSYQRAKADLITTSLWNATKNRESFEKDLNQSVEAKQVQEISAEYYKSVVKYVDEELQSYDNLTKEQEVGLSGLIATRFNLELKSSQVENQNARKRYKEKIEEINKRIEDVVGNKTPVEVAPEVQDMVSDAEVVASPEDLANVQVDSQESLTQLEQDQARLQTLQSAISENNNAIANGIAPILTQEQAAEYENEITILNQKIKDQQDAIQEQSTAAISVQPEPQTGEGVGGQVQAKPEVTTREGEVETEVEVAKEEVTGLVQDEAFDNSSDTKSFVGSFVDYQGVRGVLLEDGQGNIIVDTGQGDVLVEGALSDMTNKDLGLSRAERAEISDEDVQKIEQDVAANIDPTVIQTDFGTGRIVYGNREFKYESSNLDKDGNTVSIDVTDANGKKKTIRNKQAVEEIELQKMIFEDLLNNNKITLDNEFAKQFQAQATNLGIKPTVTAPQRTEGRAQPVQQVGPAEGVKGPEAKPAAVAQEQAEVTAEAAPVEIKGFEVRKKDGTTVPPSNYRKNPNTGKWVKVNEQGKATPVSSPAIVEQLNNEQARLQKGKTPAVTPQPVQAPTVTVKAPTIEVTPQPEAKEAGVEKTEQKAETKPETTTTKPAQKAQVAEPAPAKKTPAKPKKEQPKKEEPATKAKSLSQEADDLFDSLFDTEEGGTAQGRTSPPEGPIQKGDAVLPTKEENQSAIDALATFLKEAGITVTVLDSLDFKQKAQGNGMSGPVEGLFIVEDDSGKVYLNRDKIEGEWGKTIIFHEGIHPVINIIRNTNPKLFNSILKGIKAEAKKNLNLETLIKDVSTSEQLKDKPQEIIDDEIIVETLARIASGRLRLSEIKPTLKDMMVNFYNKIATYLKLPKISNLSTDQQFRDFAIKLSDAIQKGGKLSELVGDENIHNYVFDISIPGVISYGQMSSGIPRSGGPINLYQGKNILQLPIRPLQDIYDSYGGNVVVINSDPTRAGKLKLQSGNEIFMYGGPGYLAIEDNVNGNVGFATTQFSKVKNWSDYVRELFGDQPGVTLVATQAPSSLLSNSYSLRYVLDAIFQLPESVKTSPEFRKEFFGEDLAALKNAFGEGKFNDFLTKYGDSDFTDSENIEKMISEMSYKIGTENTGASFVARSSFLSNLLGGIKPNKGGKGYVSVDPKKYISKKLMDNFGINAEKVMRQIGHENIVDLYMKEGIWGLAVSGFETDPGLSIESVQEQGVLHPLFNAKFPGVNPFLLEGAYEVDAMFPAKVLKNPKYKTGVYVNKASTMLSGSMYVKGGDTQKGFEFKSDVPPSTRSIQLSAGINRTQVLDKVLPPDLDIIKGWYSPIQKRLLETKIGKQSANKWLTSGLIGKGDEAIYTGVKGWLESKNPQEQVDKKDILDWMRKNRVQIKQTYSEEYNDEIYQLKGDKSDYKTILVTLPGKTTSLNDISIDLYGVPFDQLQVEYPNSFESKRDRVVEVRDRTLESGEGGKKFISSHFPKEPNVLVHLRMNTRSDIDGNKILFLEEVQSDWAQTGKKDGFNDPDEQKRYEEFTKDQEDYQKLLDDISDERAKFRENEDLQKSIETFKDSGYFIGVNFKGDGKKYVYKEEPGKFSRDYVELTDEEIPSEIKKAFDVNIKITENYNKLDLKKGEYEKKYGTTFDSYDPMRRSYLTSPVFKLGNIPTAPFVTNTNAWVKLGLKIALREAVKRGVDKIAWTTGEQQLDRYPALRSRGKEGMTAFYDRIVPDVAKSLLKELTGKSIEIGETNLVKIEKLGENATIEENRKGLFNIYDRGKSPLPIFRDIATKEEALSILNRSTKIQMTQQSISLPGELKTTVVRGLPQFSAGIKRESTEARVLPEGLSITEGWYSPIEKRLLETKVDKLSANRWLNDGFIGRGDEATYTGVRNWLESKNPQEQVSKKDIIEWIKNNRVEISEVVNNKEGNELKLAREEALNEYVQLGLEQEYWKNELLVSEIDDTDLEYFESKDELENELIFIRAERDTVIDELVELDNQIDNVVSENDYSAYQLPGYKTNYKETLITLNKRNIFQSSHFKDANILVHLRTNIREDEDGNKVLFLEEIQSDWAQEGRRRGFQGQVVKPAPYVTDTNAWVKLGLKVALREAISQGATKIAWTTGQQQYERWGSERFDWAKGPSAQAPVKTKKGWIVNGEPFSTREEASAFANRPNWIMSFHNYYNGSFNEQDPYSSIDFEGLARGGRLIYSKEDVQKMLDLSYDNQKTQQEKQKMADRIWDMMQNGPRQNSLLPRREGMKAFYDKQIPSVLGPLVKELTGKTADIVTTSIQKFKNDVWELSRAPGLWANTIHGGAFGSEQIERTFESKEDADKDIKERLEAAEFLNPNIILKQQSIEITPELKSSVVKGIPQFSAGINRGTFDARNPGPKGEQAFIKDKNALIEGIKKKIADAAQNKPYKEIDFIKDMAIRGITITPEDATLLFKRATVPSTLPRTSQRILETASIPENIKDAIVEQTKPKQSVTDEDLEALADSVLEEATMAETDKEAVEIYEQTVNDIIDQLGPKFSRMLLGEGQLIYELRVLKKIAEALKNMGNMQGATDVLQIITNFGSISGRALREMGLNFSADAIYIETLSRNSDPNNEIILNNRVSATSNKTNREAIEEISQATSQSMQENAAEIAANAAARAAKAKAKMDEKKAEEKTTTPTTTEKLREAAKAINQKATEKLNLFNDIMKQLRGLKLAYDPKQEASLLADASKAFLMYAYYKTSGSIIRARIMFLEMADLKKAHKDVDKYIAELSKDEFPAATREIAKAKILEALQEDEKQQTKTPTPAQLIARRIKAFDRKNQRVKPTPKTLEQRINDLDLDITILTELRDSIEAELLPLPEDKRAEMMSKVEDLLFELKSEKLKKRAAPWITKTQIRKDFKEGLKSLEETITDLITDWSKIDVYTKNIGEEFIKRTGMTAEEAKPFINIIEQEINKIVDTKIKSDIEKQIRESYSGNRDELTDRIKSKESEIEYLTGLIENLEAKDKTTEEVAILKERKKRLGQAKKELNNLKGALKKFDDISERAMKSGDFRRMLAAIKTNGLNSDTVLQEFAYTLGLDVLNRDDLDRINFMTQKIKNAMTAADEIAATKELEKFVYSISNISALEQFHRIYESFLYGNMLSSPRTAEVAFFSGMFGLFRDFVGNFGVAIIKDILNVAPITYRDGFKVKGVEVIPKNTLLVLSAVLDTFGTNKVFDFRTLVDVLKGAEGITIQQSDIDKKGQDRLFASLNEIEKADALIKRIKENKNWTKRPQDLSKVSALEAFKFQQRMARLLVVGDYMARSAAIPYATRMITAEMAMESLPVGSSFLSIYKKSSALINRARAKELAEIRAAQMADAGLGFDKKRYERKIAVEALPEEVQQQIKDYADRLAWTGRIMGKSGQYSKATNNLYTKGLGEPFGVSGGKRVRDEGTLVSIGKLARMMFVTTVKMLTIPFPGVQFRGAQMIKNSLPLAGIIQKRMILDENGNYIPKGGFQLFSEYREYSSAGKVIDVVKATKWDFWNRAAASALPVIFSSFLFQAMFTFKFDDEEEDKKYNELGALDPRQLMMIYDQASEGKVSVDLDSREDWFITGDYDNDVKAVLESKGTQYEPFAIYKKDERGVFKKIPFLGSYKDAPYGVYLNGMAAVFERNLLAKQVKGSGKATRDPLTPGELFAIMSFGSVSFLGEFGLNGVSDNIKIVTALFEDNPEALSKVDYTFKRLQQNAVRQNIPQSAFASFWANIRGMYTGEGKRKGLDVVDGALANTYVMGDLVDTYDYDALGRRIPYQESPYPLLAGLERGIASVNNSAYSILNSTVFEQTITNADRIRTKEVDFAALIRKMSTQDVLKTEMTVVAMGDEEVRYFMGLEAANNKFKMLEDYYEYLDSLDRSDLSKRLRAVNTKGNEHAFCNYVLGVLETKAEEFNFKTDITVNDLRELISTIPEDGIGLTSKHEATKKGVLKYNEDGTPVLKPAYYKKSKLIDFLYKNNIHIKADGSIDFTKNYSAIYNDDVHEEYMLNSLMEEIFEEDME